MPPQGHHAWGRAGRVRRRAQSSAPSDSLHDGRASPTVPKVDLSGLFLGLAALETERNGVQQATASFSCPPVIRQVQSCPLKLSLSRMHSRRLPQPQRRPPWGR